MGSLHKGPTSASQTGNQPEAPRSGNQLIWFLLATLCLGWLVWPITPESPALTPESWYNQNPFLVKTTAGDVAIPFADPQRGAYPHASTEGGTAAEEGDGFDPDAESKKFMAYNEMAESIASQCNHAAEGGTSPDCTAIARFLNYLHRIVESLHPSMRHYGRIAYCA